MREENGWREAREKMKSEGEERRRWKQLIEAAKRRERVGHGTVTGLADHRVLPYFVTPV